jgi:hypothetical protein
MDNKTLMWVALGVGVLLILRNRSAGAAPYVPGDGGYGVPVGPEVPTQQCWECRWFLGGAGIPIGKKKVCSQSEYEYFNNREIGGGKFVCYPK